MENNKKQGIYKTIMLVIITVFITFIITSIWQYSNLAQNGIYIAIDKEEKSNPESITKYLNAIRAFIEKNYLWTDKINEKSLRDGAVKGYVEGLGDEYTEYIPADDMEEYKTDILGTYVGIGIYMIADTENNKILVYYPIEGSPAEEAGIKTGDVIFSVDGVEYTVEDFDIIASKIKGEEGTKVTLGIVRDGEKMTFEVERKKVNANPITEEMINDNIGYVRIPTFTTDTAKSFKEKIEEFKKNGMKSLIIDLRNNGGGILNEATEIADYIMKKGDTIITVIDKNGKEEKTISKEEPIFDFPIVILVNGNTASASEILTGALKDAKKAIVIGTKTYGKGIIQSVYPLSDGSAIKITTGEYCLPNGEKIHGKGINPDIEIKNSNSTTNNESEKEDDEQLQRAIKYLQEN